MKTFVLIIAIALSSALNAQVSKVRLQASGLTCSMCSNAINKALKTLDVVAAVDANIKTYTFEISFKPNTVVDFEQIKRKVEGAGFSISSFTAFIAFDSVTVRPDEAVTVDNRTFLFDAPTEQVLNGLKEIRVLNKGFVSPAAYRKNNYPSPPPGTYHVSM